MSEKTCQAFNAGARILLGVLSDVTCVTGCTILMKIKTEVFGFLADGGTVPVGFWRAFQQRV